MRGDIFSNQKKQKPSDINNFDSSATPVKSSNKKENEKLSNSSNHKPSKRFLISLAIIVLLIISPIVWYFYSVSAPTGKSDKNIAFEIVDGQTTLDIAQNLKEKGLIRNKYSFGFYVYLNDTNLLPGIYYLKKNMNMKELLEPISKGQIQEHKVTILEGWRREEIGQMLAKQDIVKYEDFVKASEGKEGYLFPDTYRLAKDATANEIVNILIDNFNKKIQSLNINKDDLILASIIEREAGKDEDRPKIAGVYKNRLNANMKLDADPTVQYAKGNWEPITVSDYKTIESRYNTYLYKGLPPGPICSPGLSSIKSAINPEKNNYFYFLHSENGETLYAKTLEEHNKNKK